MRRGVPGKTNANKEDQVHGQVDFLICSLFYWLTNSHFAFQDGDVSGLTSPSLFSLHLGESPRCEGKFCRGPTKDR